MANHAILRHSDAGPVFSFKEAFMKTRLITLSGAALILLGLVALVGCSKRDDSSTAGQKVDSAMANADAKTDAAKAELQRDADKIKESAGRAVTAVEDTAITAGIKAKLATDSDLKTLDISVETSSGRATLRGKAPDAASQARATQLAAAVTGVTSVDNQLTVMQ
jgi:hyperosmotically inducible periplasmic protein